jgi:hypothetical protein
VRAKKRGKKKIGLRKKKRLKKGGRHPAKIYWKKINTFLKEKRQKRRRKIMSKTFHFSVEEEK